MKVVEDRLYMGKNRFFLVKVTSIWSIVSDEVTIMFEQEPNPVGTFTASLLEFKAKFRELTEIENILYG